MERVEVSHINTPAPLQPSEYIFNVASLGDEAAATLTLQFPEQQVTGKVTKSDKALISANWQTLREHAGGEAATADSLRASVRGVLEQLSPDSKFDLSMKRSFEKRLEAVERTELLEEIRATNSPWMGVIDLAKDKLHGTERTTAKDRFADNYIGTSLLHLKSKVSQFAEQHPREDVDKKLATDLLEREVVTLCTDYLSGLTDDQARQIKFKDVLSTAAEARFGEKMTRQELFARLDSEISTTPFEAIAQVTAEDIQITPALDSLLPVQVQVDTAADVETQAEVEIEAESEPEERSMTRRIRDMIKIPGREAVTKILQSVRTNKITKTPDNEGHSADTTDVFENETPYSYMGTRLNRRQVIGLAAATVGAKIVPPAVRVGLDPEFQAGVAAALSRSELPGSAESHEVSLSVLLEMYKKHFSGKEHVFPQESWVRTETTDQGEKLLGNGVHLATLAQQCYESEKMDGEDFDSYYKRFVDNLRAFSDLAGLDFTTLVTTLQISAENLGSDDHKRPKERSNTDINVSRVQEVLIPAARVLGLEDDLIESLGPGGFATNISNKANDNGISTPLEEASSGDGIRHYDLIRFRQQPTTGIMDMEPGERAEAFRMLQDNTVSQMMQDEFPEICDAYVNVNEKRNEVTSIREALRKEAKIYIENYAESLHAFAEGDQIALEAIGISPSMDLWQLQNYTDAWYKVSEIPTNPEFGYQRTVEYMRQEAAKDPQAFYRRFISQQIRNPKFLNYLLHNAGEANRSDEENQLLRIAELVNTYENRAKNLRVAHLQALEAEGSHEYDSRFQQMASVLLTKRLSEIAGDFDPDDRDSIGWHIYKTCAIREIAPMTLLVNDDMYARDITIDSPYAPEALASSLDIFADMMIDAGILQVPPSYDMNAAYRTLEKMFWRDGGVWPSVPHEQWQDLLNYFNKNLVNRLFYDFAGLFNDGEKMAELNGLMLQTGLISRPAQEDPYNFFTQIVYLSVNSPHMRPDISEENWNMIQGYFQTAIMPMVITNEQVSPGVFQEKWNIGSADYPPIFRAQAVMYNYLIDKNETPPDSSSSADILGHH